MKDKQRPRIVIVGAGFGGLFCAKGLAGTEAEITLIDRQNHHLFQPLLYQVATGFLSPSDIAIPIRSLFRHQHNVFIVMDDVTAIDLASKRVVTQNGEYEYDYLVVATGATYHFFGHPEWQEHTVAIKSIEDALALRHSIFTAFEKAELENNEKERRKLLTFVVIGGGPTGVEVAGAIADLIHYLLKREFRRISPQDTQVILLEAGERLLSTMPLSLSKYTQKHLEQLAVKVRCRTKVKEIRAGIVVVENEEIASHSIIWAAGIHATPVAKWLGITGQDRVSVEGDLSVKGLKNVFVIGDASQYIQEGKPLPGLAAVAKQQGKYLAKRLKHQIRQKPFDKKFKYIDLGTMATIGRNAAVADFGQLGLKGFFAWVLWSIVHIYFLIGFRNRIVVSLSWLWSYITFGVGDRIILNTEKKKNN